MAGGIRGHGTAGTEGRLLKSHTQIFDCSGRAGAVLLTPHTGQGSTVVGILSKRLNDRYQENLFLYSIVKLPELLPLDTEEQVPSPETTVGR